MEAFLIILDMFILWRFKTLFENAEFGFKDKFCYS